MKKNIKDYLLENTDLSEEEIIKVLKNLKDGTPLSYEEWYDLNYEELQIRDAETGADRELDYNPDGYEKEYESYLMNFSDQNIILDKFHYHEAIDRTFMIMEMVDNFLIEHPLFRKLNDCKKDANEIMDRLCDLYQKIAKLDY